MKILIVELTKFDVIEILMFIMKKPEKPKTIDTRYMHMHVHIQ